MTDSSQTLQRPKCQNQDPSGCLEWSDSDSLSTWMSELSCLITPEFSSVALETGALLCATTHYCIPLGRNWGTFGPWERFGWILKHLPDKSGFLQLFWWIRLWLLCLCTYRLFLISLIYTLIKSDLDHKKSIKIVFGGAFIKNVCKTLLLMDH